LLLKCVAGDGGLRPVERVAFLIGQPVKCIVTVKFIVARQHSVRSPSAIGRSVRAILNLRERRAALLLQTVVDSAKAIENRVDVARVRGHMPSDETRPFFHAQLGSVSCDMRILMSR